MKESHNITLPETDKNIHIGWSVSEGKTTEDMLSKIPECEKFSKIRDDLEKELNAAIQKIKNQHNIIISANNQQLIDIVFFIDLSRLIL